MKSLIAKTIIAVSCLHAVTAHAELQTWRLTAIAEDPQRIAFAAPSFLEPGRTFAIDYVIDTQAQANPTFIFGQAVVSMTLNGQTSATNGDILAVDGLNAINASPINQRADGIDFVSFNSFGDPAASSVQDAWAKFSGAVIAGRTELRVDFGSDSVWTRPVSLTALPVPEPSAYLMVLSGLALVASTKGRQWRGRAAA